MRPRLASTSPASRGRAVTVRPMAQHMIAAAIEKDKFTASYNMREYKWSSHSLSRFLNRTGEDPVRIKVKRSIIAGLCGGEQRSIRYYPILYRGGVFDHGDFWGRDGAPVMMVGAPYTINDREKAGLDAPRPVSIACGRRGRSTIALRVWHPPRPDRARVAPGGLCLVRVVRGGPGGPALRSQFSLGNGPVEPPIAAAISIGGEVSIWSRWSGVVRVDQHCGSNLLWGKSGPGGPGWSGWTAIAALTFFGGRTGPGWSEVVRVDRHCGSNFLWGKDRSGVVRGGPGGPPLRL